MLITIAVYLIMMVVVGVICAKKTDNVGDFYLGGRKLGPFVTAMSAEASDMSGWLLMGLPGVAYATGIADAAWTGIGLAIGTYLNWLIVSKRIRKYSHVCNSITIPDFFSNRFRDSKKILTLISALIIIVFFIPYTGSGFSACGKLFNSLFGADYHIAMIISAVVIIAYTTIGGFLAASTTDFIQSIIMSVALIIVVVFGISSVGGVVEVMNHATSMPGYFSLTHTFDVLKQQTGDYGPLTIFSTLAWGLGYFGMPQVLLRFMGIRSEHELGRSRRVAIIWVVISMAAAVFIGVVGRSVAGLDYLSNNDAENIFIDAATSYLPPILAGFACAGVLAAAISSSDSYLLISASAVSQNLYRGIVKKDATEKQVMWCSRITLMLITLVAMAIAWNSNSTIFGITAFAWAGFGAAFGPLMLFSLFWKRTTRAGAIAGMVAGGAMVFFWRGVLKPMGGVWGIYELLPAFLFSALVIVVVSLLTRKPSTDMDSEFDRIKAGQV